MDDWQLISNDYPLTIRDVWQIEGELDIAPPPTNGDRGAKSEAHVVQEFFLFLPAALHVNEYTYSKDQFYLDRTNLLRFKTPQITLEELLNPGNSKSPFTLIEKMLGSSHIDENSINFELKLLANIIRSQFRDQLGQLIDNVEKEQKIHEVEIQAKKLLETVKQIRVRFGMLKSEFKVKGLSQGVLETMYHVEEFVSRCIEQITLHTYLSLKALAMPVEALREQALNEKRERVARFHESIDIAALSEDEKEEFLYREGLLNKFMLSALLLATKRSSFAEKYGQFTASIAAGIAMSIYLLFFFWRGSLLIDSMSLIIFTSLLYVLKDRIKDGLKALFQQKASIWFNDFETAIIGPHDQKLGVIGEHFHLLDPERLPLDVISTRNEGIPEDLAKYLRPEIVLYYKKKINLKAPKKGTQERRFDYHHVFRLNLSEFLKRASNVFEAKALINSEDSTIAITQLPKVYHLNLVIKTSWKGRKIPHVSLQRFRIVANKEGILRIEEL